MSRSANDAPSEKLFAVIDCIVESRVPLSVTEIAARLGLPVPTVHRIAMQLTERGYLRRALGSKRFRMGPRLAVLGIRVVGSVFAADRPHAFLVALARRLGEHCQIGIVTDDEVIYVDSASPDRDTGLQFRPGHSAPIYCTSIGKLHLAQLDDDDLTHVLTAIHYKRFTPTTICQSRALLLETQRVRKRGWAATNGEYTPGVVGCAVPIVGASGRLIAGLGLSAPQAHMAFANVRTVIPAMQDAAVRIGDAVREDMELL